MESALDTPQTTPPQYFPLTNGPYRITAGLSKLGRDFGNGKLDAHVVQIDRQFSLYRQTILASRQERLDKYVITQNFDPLLQAAVCKRLITILTTEYPHYFQTRHSTDDQIHLDCTLTGETLVFNSCVYDPQQSRINTQPPYIHGFDALVSQIPEDLAVITTQDSGDHIVALHICAPGHWAPDEKIGLDFTQVHAPVPGMQHIVKQHHSMVSTMIDHGPWVRFVWGFATDERLNHHPQPPPDCQPHVWRGRCFDPTVPDSSTFYLRIERQVMVGLPHEGACLFFIHVSHLEGNTIRQNDTQRIALLSALESMTDQTLAYKGLSTSRDALIHWLRQSTNHSDSPSDH